MKRFLIAIALACALSSAAFGGNIPTLGTPTPCVDCPTMSGEPSPGDIPSVGLAEIASEGLLDLVGALSSLVF